MLPFCLQFYAEISVAESWMDEKMPILNGTEYGKDEDSVQVCGIMVSINFVSTLLCEVFLSQVQDIYIKT